MNKLGASQARVSADGIWIDDLALETNQSKINNSLSLIYSGYTDFQSFVDSVRMDIPEASMHVNVRDLMALAPGLSRLDFFMQNQEKNIDLNGQVSGIVNRLRIKRMNAGLMVIHLA